MGYDKKYIDYDLESEIISSWRTTIPVTVRKHYNLIESDKLKWLLDKDRKVIILKVIPNEKLE